MPNYVKNVLKIKTHKIDDLMNKITSPNKTVEHPLFPIDYVIDFDKIIPQPRKIEDCSPLYIIPETKREKPGIEITDDRSWFNWYNWNIDNWGTKWNAYDNYTIIKKSYVIFVFSTAWSTPDEIYRKLAEMGYVMDIKYADEDLGGNNYGKLYYDGTEWSHEKPKYGRKWARDLWAKY